MSIGFPDFKKIPAWGWLGGSGYGGICDREGGFRQGAAPFSGGGSVRIVNQFSVAEICSVMTWKWYPMTASVIAAPKDL